MKKQYKALMLDLDKTTIPGKINSKPSIKVQKALKKAQNYLQVSAVTGRPFHVSSSILSSFFNGPSIICGGAQIVESVTGEIIWERYLIEKDLVLIKQIIEELHLAYMCNYSNGNSGFLAEHNHSLQKIIGISIPDIDEGKIDILLRKLSFIKDIAVNKVFGYEGDKDWIQITHAEATKQHAIFEVAKILGIETHEIIGVGDGYNDFPLLMACGLKIAMGNAVPELKEIADYIAPSVDEDGVADVIEKFIL